MVTWFNPTSMGIVAYHWIAPNGPHPVAVPAAPVLVAQVTLTIPDRSDTVPVNVSESRVVANDVLAG